MCDACYLDRMRFIQQCLEHPVVNVRCIPWCTVRRILCGNVGCVVCGSARWILYRAVSGATYLPQYGASYGAKSGAGHEQLSGASHAAVSGASYRTPSGASYIWSSVLCMRQCLVHRGKAWCMGQCPVRPISKVRYANVRCILFRHVPAHSMFGASNETMFGLPHGAVSDAS